MKMMTLNDHQLLAQYVNGGSQDAFAELVARHLNFVYSAALRQVRTGHLAEEVAQMVFTTLARKAASLPRNVVLAGWLHRTARYTALDLLRKERRRQAREQEALAMNNLNPAPAPDWEQLRPLLDAALDQLAPVDRDALLLRFFEQRSLKEIGTVLGSGEEAARKRVTRALDKLRTLLERHGVTTTASALSAAIMANGVQAAPASLGSTIVSTSLAAGLTTATGTTASQFIKSLVMTKLKTAIIATAITAGIATSIIQSKDNRKLRTENRTLQEQNQSLAQLRSENERLSNLVTQADHSGLAKDQLSELLRLRGEVTRLRNELKNSQAPPQASLQKPALTSANNDSPKPYSTKFIAHIGNGQTLVTGGWSTTPGKRTMLITTPTIIQPEGGGVKQVLIQSTVLEVPEGLELMPHFGIDQLKEFGQLLLPAADAANIINELKKTDGVSILSQPRAVTLSGTPAQISMVSNQPNRTTPNFNFGLTPNVTTDGSAVDLSFNGEINPPNTSSPTAQ